MDVVSMIEQGVELQKLGDFSGAESIYQRVLSRDAGNPDAHHLLAVIRNQEGKSKEALNLVNHAISVHRCAIYLNTRGMIFIELQHFDDAQNDLRAALKLAPEYAEAYNNLAIVQHRKRDLGKALTNAQKAVLYKSDFPQGWATLGSVLFDQNNFDAAEDAYEKALVLNPNTLVAESNLAKIAYMRGESDKAMLKFERVEKKGVFAPGICYPHALLLISKGALSDAAVLIRSCYEKNEDWSDLPGLVEQNPFFGVLHQVCTFIGEVQGDRNTAYKIYLKTVEHVPRMGHLIWNNIGKIFFDLHRVDEGIAFTQKALESPVTTPEAKAMAYNNLGVFYMAKEDSPKAIENFRNALMVQPGQVLALGWLLKEKAHICDWDGFAELREQVDAIRQTENTAAIAPFTPLAVYNDPQALKYWASLSAYEIFDTTAKQSAAIVLPEKRKPGKIRIGYYSFDFRNHPVAYLTARLFELHNKDEFEIFAYSYGPDDDSEIRWRIQQSADAFVDLKDMSVVETAYRIAADEIDFLIDLTGNTKHHRCQTLALRPARKQAHWLGFIGTMGSDYYDYIIADDIVAPLQDQDGFVEQLLHLESGFHIADDSRVVKPCAETRHELGLPEDGTVFGCFAQTFKIQPETFDLWMRILKQVPGSVLWLANGPKGSCENLRKEMAARGVAPERLVIAQRCDREKYLSRFSLIDLHLDTFPYTSGTVASDALFSGCPLVTLTGRTMVSRMAGSILAHAGLSQLVTQNPEDYVQIAVRLAQNPQERQQIRNALLQKRDNGNLLSAKKIVESLENATKHVLI